MAYEFFLKFLLELSKELGIIIGVMGKSIVHHVVVVNGYSHCNETWTDTGDCEFNSPCPDCGHEIEPATSEVVHVLIPLKGKGEK